MKITYKLLIPLYLCLTMGWTAVPTSKVINGIKNCFEKINDFESSITQSLVDMSNSTTLYTGEVSFKKPRKLRLTYYTKKSNKPSQIAISDGESLYVYTAELNQITKQKMDPKSLPLPLLILGGATQIDEHFREKNYIKPIERVSLQGVKTYIIIVKPKTQNPDFKEQILWVDVNTYLPVKARVTDTLGNIATVEFKDIKSNQGIPDSEFIMNKKTGVNFVELPD